MRFIHVLQIIWLRKAARYFQCHCCINTIFIAHWPSLVMQTSARHSFSAFMSKLWIMTQRYCVEVSAHVTSSTNPMSTETALVPQTPYDVVSTSVPAVGAAVRYPTWKLSNAFTTAVQTNSVFSKAGNNILFALLRLYVRISQVRRSTRHVLTATALDNRKGKSLTSVILLWLID